MTVEWISATLMVLGAVFVLLAAIGVLRFPDLYSRMHAATKASSFGVTLMLIGLAILYPNGYVIVISLLIILFIYITAPIASHMIGRVAHLLKVKVQDDNALDELEEATRRSEQEGQSSINGSADAI